MKRSLPFASASLPCYRPFLALVVVLLSHAGGGLFAAPAPAPTQASRETETPAQRTARESWAFTPDPALPNVLILGDSISVGYTRDVRARLAGRANVFRPMAPNGAAPENCQGTTLGLQKIDTWLAGRKWDVIHFNWGLHDLKHVNVAGSSENSNEATDPVQATLAVYQNNLRQIVAKLKATGARLVFATTTPVAPETTGPLRSPDSPPAYNAAALEVMQPNAIRVNDLFSLGATLAHTQMPRNVHYTAAGLTGLGEAVAAAIGEELKAGRK
jgi:acyl-CoA thioesterase-1